MKDFVISTESNADLSDDFIRENGICVIPHYYSIEDEVYGEEKLLTIPQFYDAMRAGKTAATMASNPAVIEEKFGAYAKEGKDILHISFSSELSAGCSNVVVTAAAVMEEYPGSKIFVVDTLSASLGEMMMIVKALELKKAGRTIEETRAELEALVPNICVLFTVDDLNHLFRGGRLSKTQAVVGSLIDVKPILHINDGGKLVALQKTRGRKKSMNMMLANMEERLGSWRDRQIIVGILHGDSEEDAEYLRRHIEDVMGYKNTVFRPIGPSIGAHSGPGALGITFMGEYR